MIALICFVLAVLASPFKSKSRLEAENAALRHQLIVLRRKMPGRPWLTNNDRWFFLQMYRWFPSILKVVRIKPQRPCLDQRNNKSERRMGCASNNGSIPLERGSRYMTRDRDRI